AQPEASDLLALVAPSLRAGGLPPVQTLADGPGDAEHLGYTAVLLGGRELRVLVPRQGLVRRPVEHARAAHEELKRSGWPVPEVFRTVWSDALGDRILIRSPPAGQQAAALAERGILDRAELLDGLAGLLARRGTQHGPAGVADEGFLPASSFRDVLHQLLLDTDRAVRAVGLDAGPAVPEVVGRFAAALDAVELPEGNALTHGALSLEHVWMGEEGVAEVTGWTRAMRGDPLYDVGGLLGIGEDAVHAALLAIEQPDDPDRLALGWFGAALGALAHAASRMSTAGGAERSAIATGARQALERALDLAPAGWACPTVTPSPPGVWLRITDVARSLPPPDRRDLAHVAGAVAALDVPSWSPEVARAVAHRHLHALRPRLLAPPDDPEEAEVPSDRVLARIQDAAFDAFGGWPPTGFLGGLAAWDARIWPPPPTDAFESLRERCVLAWAGDDQDASDLLDTWDMLSWRIEEPLAWDEALERARVSRDPLDVCRVLGAASLTGGPPLGDVLAVLFSAG
ncbi:MAG: hypothetical protein KC656_16560, partial [Myxococcales bacterium]|nr:hypothetical protein [Myxococcales bacterium]